MTEPPRRYFTLAPARADEPQYGIMTRVRYFTEIRLHPRGATRDELAAEIARLEALGREDPSWGNIPDGFTVILRKRIEDLESSGRHREIGWADIIGA